MTIFFPLLLALVGVLMFGLCKSPKLVRIGEIMFFCGLLAFLLHFSGFPFHEVT
jgi:hypothetical protein